jgi:S1-C subfamily serine protease
VRIVASIGTGGRIETSTGMVLSDDGRVVTNNHGVTGATAVQVTVMSTGRTYTATVAATDVAHDVALLRLHGARGLAGVTLAQREPAVGDRVAVVGDAGGRRSRLTAATGSVLALHQTLVTPKTATAAGERLTGMILDSCNVAIGESGGPTYGVGGRVVGMTTARIPSRTRIDGAAIPIDTLRSVLRELKNRAG